MADNIFTRSSLGDLGVSAGYSTKSGVDTMFQDTYMGVDVPCVYCGRTADYKVMPKNTRVASAQVENAHVCKNCLNMGYLDKKNFGIREL